jgi:ATP-dependent Clp protease ATP-binding subunit ClpA
MTGGIGFAPARPEDEELDQLTQKIHRVAVDAARRRFSPEFMNRLDKTLVFRTLDSSDLDKILEIELNAIQTRIFTTQTDRPFALFCSPKAKEFLLTEGTDRKYGARHLKRALERYLIVPLSSLLATEQIYSGDTVLADLVEGDKELTFSKTNTFFRTAAAAAVHGSVIESSAIL